MDERGCLVWRTFNERSCLKESGNVEGMTRREEVFMKGSLISLQTFEGNYFVSLRKLEQ